MTSPDHPTGTDRIAEALRADARRPPTSSTSRATSRSSIPRSSTNSPQPWPPIRRSTWPPPPTRSIPPIPPFSDPNVVKVVTALDGRALYFSRSPLPFFRNAVARPAGPPPQGHLRLQPEFPRTLRHLAALAAGTSRVPRTTPRPRKRRLHQSPPHRRHLARRRYSRTSPAKSNACLPLKTEH